MERLLLNVQGTNQQVYAQGTPDGKLLVDSTPTQIIDVALAAITATANTATFTPTSGLSYQVNIPVTAVGGTNPTMDIGIEESEDGINWLRIYDFPRITGVGMNRSPKLSWTGNRLRYVQVLGGTSPSFTRSINRQQFYDAAPEQNSVIFDESILPLGVGALFTGAARDSGASTGKTSRWGTFNGMVLADQAGTVRVEVSRDGLTDWRRATADFAVAANTPVVFSTPVLIRYYRLLYTNGATAQGSFLLQSGFTAA